MVKRKTDVEAVSLVTHLAVQTSRGKTFGHLGGHGRIQEGHESKQRGCGHMFCKISAMQTKRLIQGIIVSSMLSAGLTACQSGAEKKKAENAGKGDTVTAAAKQPVDLPAPYATPSVSGFSEVIGWPEGKTPVAPDGFTVTRFASGLNNPRWIYVAKNGDIFVAESTTESSPLSEAKSKITGRNKSVKNQGSANRITLLRDSNHDGRIDLQTVFLTGLKQNFGMLIIGNTFYSANTDGVMAFPYQYGQTKITAPGRKIISLPAGGYNNHWTRN